MSVLDRPELFTHFCIASESFTVYKKDNLSMGAKQLVKEKDKLVNSAIKVAAPVVFMDYLIITSLTTTSTYFIPNLGLTGAHLGAASSTIMVIRVIRKGMA